MPRRCAPRNGQREKRVRATVDVIAALPLVARNGQEKEKILAMTEERVLCNDGEGKILTMIVIIIFKASFMVLKVNHYLF